MSKMSSVRGTFRRYVGATVAALLVGTALPAVAPTAANAAFGGVIGGEPGYTITGTTAQLNSGTATITLKYLKKDRSYTNMRAWVWCNSGSGSWGGSPAKQGSSNASGSCTNGAAIDLNNETDSWGASNTFTITGVTNLVSLGMIVYNGTGDCCGTRDSQSTNNRYISVNGSTTVAWFSDDGKNIYDGDPKSQYSTAQQYSSGAIRIHYNRVDKTYTNWYARLGFEKGTNSNVNYTNGANSTTWHQVQSYNFLTGATSGSLGTVTQGTDAYGAWVQLAPSSSFYTGGYTYYDMYIGQATSLANADAGTWAANDNTRYLAPTVTSGVQHIFIKNDNLTTASATNPYAAPTVTSSPANVASAGGTSVTLTGSNLYPVTGQTPSVILNGTRTASVAGTGSDSITGGTSATVTAVSATSLTFTMPATTAGANTIYVSTAGGVTTGTAITTVAAPTLSALASPSPVRGQQIAVSGTNLTGATFTIGGVSASASITNATTATVTVPTTAPVAAATTMAVTTTGGTATTSITVIKGTPTISGCSATGITVGQTLANSTLSGCTASINGVTVAGTYAFATPTTAPAVGTASYTVNFTPTDSTGFNSTTSSASVTTSAGAPSITSVSSPSPVRGQSITVTGTNLLGTTWTFGGATITPSPLTDTSATLTVPTNAAMGANTLAATSGGGSASTSISVTKGTPTVTGCSATAVTSGQTLASSTISGCTASIDGVSVAGSAAWATPTAVPTNGGSYSITFTPTDTTGFNNGTGSATVTVNPAPAVTSVVNTTLGSGAEGKIGDTITITGSNFTGATSAAVGGTNVTSFTVVNSTTITGVIASGTTTGSAQAVTVVKDVTSNATVTFTVWATPSLTSLSASAGKANDSITITGTGMKPSASNPTVTVGGISATVTSATNTSVTFTVPSGLTQDAASNVVLTNSVGSASNALTFTARGVPTLTAISPTPYAVRGTTTVTLTGTNFLGATSVSFGSTVQSTITVVSSTSITAVVPVGASTGVQTVSVTNPAGTSGTVNLNIGDAPAASPSASATRGASVTIAGTGLTGSTWTFAGSAITPTGVTATSATFTIPTNATFGATTLVGTTNFGTTSVAFTVLGYSSATLTIHYNKQDFSFSNTYIHSWVNTGTGTASGSTVSGSSPETSVTDLGVDSYGGVARITYTGSNIQQVGYLVWTLPGATKDTGSASDRYRTLSTSADEIWIRNYDSTVGTSDLFAGINPSPNRSATQTITVHYDGDTATYPKLYLATRSDLNDGASNYSYWVAPATLDFTTPVAVSGATGTSTSTVGTDQFGKYVTYTFPYNAAHSTWAYMIVGSSGLATKDGGQSGTGNRYLALSATGSTTVYLKSGDVSGGDVAGNAAYAANPYASPAVTSVTASTGKAGDSVTIAGTGLKAGSFTPTVTIGGVNATVSSSTSTSVVVTVPSGLTDGVANAVVVSNQGGISNSNNTFTVVAAPSLTSVSPTSGIRGDSITFTGTNFTGATAVNFGSVAATSYTVDSSTQITATVPTAAANGLQNVSVVTAGGTATLTNGFTVNKTTPSVTATPTAAAITYGSALSSATLGSGSATTAGTFAYATPTAVPNAGTYSASVVFTPSNTTIYNTVTFSIDVTVNKATPTVTTTPTASAITYGQTLASSSLSGGSVSVAGSWDWQDSTTAPSAGTASFTAVFTPTDAANYNTVNRSISVTTNKATPSITATPTAAGITYGQELGAATLSNGAADVAGTFAFADQASKPNAGTANHSVTFVPTDSANYNSVTGIQVSVTVAKATPTIAATPTATSITYGQTIASATLSGGSATIPSSSGPVSVSGSFAFATPTTAPNVGTASYEVIFSPTDSSNFNEVSGIEVSVTTNKATPTVTATPTVAAMTYGDTLQNANLANGSATVAGAFTFDNVGATPAATLTNAPVTFTPTDTSNYNTVSFNVAISVAKATPLINATPVASKSPIRFGNTLEQIGLTGGSASVAGSFAYATPSAEPTQGSGSSAEVVFTPTDSVNYNSVTFSITFDVAASTSIITAVNPSSAPQGTSVTLTGTDFDGVVGVTIDGKSATITSYPSAAPNDTSITVTVPGNATIGSDDVVVTTGAGASNTATLNVTAGTPTVSSVSANSGIRGTSVTIYGTYFTTASDVTFDGVSASFTVVSATQISATVPSSVTNNGAVDVAVTTDGGTATKTGGFTVLKYTPTISVTPSASGITYLQTLNDSTLSGGSASVSGTFAWATPTSAPAVGSANYIATFTPDNTSLYNTVNVNVALVIGKATPEISGTLAANPITYGSRLSSATLSGASGSVAGTFAYVSPSASPVAGTANHEVVFTPTDSANYNNVTGISVSVTVNKATPTVSTAPSTSAISYGQTVSDVVISGGYVYANGVLVPGSWTWLGSGTLAPSAGIADYSAEFTPNDADNFNTISADLSVTTEQTTPTIDSTPSASPLAWGQILSDSELVGGSAINGLDSSAVSGSFSFATPNATPAVGTHSYPVTFTPDDTTNYATATVNVSVTVSAQAPSITSLSVATASPAATVVITGTNLDNLTSVTIGGASATTSSTSATSITATVPAGATKGATTLVVTTAGGSDSSAFTVLAAPTISSLSSSSVARGGSLTINGTNLNIGTFGVTVGGTSATITSSSATALTVTVPELSFGSASVVVTTSGGSATNSGFSVAGYSSATLTIHYNRQDYGFANTYIHTWVSTGTSTSVSGSTVNGTSPETLVTDLGTDSYGAVARVTYTGSNIQQVGYLVWVLTNGNSWVKDSGSGSDRFRTLTKQNDEIWIRSYDSAVGSSDLFAGIQPSPNRSATQTVKIHYDGNTSTYPKVYVGTRSDLNDGPANYAYWVGTRYLDFSTPVTNSGPLGTSTSTVGTDAYGKWVQYTFPYNAAHTTRVNMIVGNADLSVKDGGDRFADLNSSGTTEVWLTAGTSAASVTNPYPAPSIAAVTASSGKAGDTVVLTGTGFKPNSSNPTVTIGGISATVLGTPAPNASAVSVTVPSGLTAGAASAVVLSNAGGSSNSNRTFTLVAAPTITSLDKSIGVREETVVITGTNLTGATNVKFGATSASSFTVDSDTQISVTVPVGAVNGLQDVSVTTLGGTVTSTDAFTVVKTTPEVTATPTAAAITYGVALSSATLGGGSASVDGTFAYSTPTAVPNAGTFSAEVVFTPTNTTANDSITFSIDVTVNKATPSITWATPSAITYGTALSGTQLGATVSGAGGASLSGDTDYSPASGTVLNAGNGQTLSVTFTPSGSDADNYDSVTITRAINVNKATPTVMATPTVAPLTYGDTLENTNLASGSASVAGDFTFDNAGATPAASATSAAVTFTPTGDGGTSNYNTVSFNVAISVAKAVPSITATPSAAPLMYPATLPSAPAGGSASVAGSFTFDAAGTTPSVSATSAAVTFTPTDTDNYESVSFEISLTVTSGEVNVTISDTTKTYNGSAQGVTVTTDPAGLNTVTTYSWPVATPTASSTTAPTNVGTYAVSVVVADGNYVGSETDTLTINPATPTIDSTPSASGITYGDTLADSTLSGGSASFGGDSVSGTFVFADSTIAPNAGTYSASVTFNPDDANFNSITGLSVNVSVAQATQSISIDDVVDGIVLKTYNGSAQGVSVNAGGKSYSVTYDGSSTVPTNAGSYSVVATITAANYTGSASATLTIDPDTQSVSISGLNKTYTGSAQGVTVTTARNNYDVEYSGINGTTYGPTADEPTNTGEYAVTVTSNDSNYTFTGTTTGTLVIGKATPSISVTPSASGITYGDSLSDSSLTGGVADVAGDFAFATPTAQPNVATTSAAVVFTPTDTTNYESRNFSVNILVAKAGYVVTISDLNKTYNGSAQGASVDAGNFTVDVTYAWPTASPTATSTTAPTNAGSYTVSAVIVDDNYSGSASETLVIAKATPEVNATPNVAALTYGDTLNNTDLANGEASVDGEFTFDAAGATPEATATSAAVTFTPTDTANYDAVQFEVDIAVAKAVPSIDATPTAATITYGQTLDDATLSGGSAVNSISGASVSGSGGVGGFAFATPTAVPTVGTLTALVVFTPADATNYDETQISVSITVNKAQAAISISGKTKTYNSSGQGVSVTESNGQEFTVTYTGVTASYGPTTDLPVNAGTYSVLVTVETANYTGSENDTLVINKRSAGLTPQTQSSPYTGSGVNFIKIMDLWPGTLSTTVTYAGTGGTTYGPSTTAPTAVGSYSATITSADSNWSLNTVSTLNITKTLPTVDVHPTAAAITYGQTLASATLTGGSAVFGGNAVDGTFAFATPTAAPVVATTTAAVIFTPTGSDANTFNPRTISVAITVNKAQPGITISGNNKVFNGQPQGIGVAVSPAGLPYSTTYQLVSPAPSVSASPTSQMPTAAGRYKVVVSVNSANHAGSQEGVLTIAGATPTITWASPSPATIAYSATGKLSGVITKTPVVKNGSTDVTAQGTLSYTLGGNPVTLASALPAAGDYEIVATWTPTNPLSFAEVTTTVAFSVQKGNVNNNIVFTGVAAGGTLNTTYDGSPKSVVANVSGVSPSPAVNIRYLGSDNGGTPYDEATAPTRAGTYTVTATVNSQYYAGTNSVTLVIQRAAFSVSWPTPSPAITYGAALSSDELDAVPAVSASPVYSPNLGTVLNAGTGQNLSVTFNPVDSVNYRSVTATNKITVLKATPVITWASPAAISYGTALSATQLNATASHLGNDISDNGAWSYGTNAIGTVLKGGLQTLKVTFTPTDAANFVAATGQVGITVNKVQILGITVALASPSASPVVTKTFAPGARQSVTVTTNPAGRSTVVTYSGTEFGGAAYPASTLAPINAGTYTATVQIASSDAEYYGSTSVTLQINRAKVSNVTWINTSQTYTGSPLTPTASVAPTTAPAATLSFVGTGYGPTSTPPTNAGTYTVTATIDNGNYYDTKTSTFTITKATPTIGTTPVAAPLTYRQPVNQAGPLFGSSTYLGSSVAGSFAFATPTARPTAGTSTAPARFTPTDTVNFNSVNYVQPISVAKASLVGVWSNPADITYGTKLSTTQLNARASYSPAPGATAIGTVAGTWSYSPAPNALLSAGDGQTLTGSFTPTDTSFNAIVGLTVTINVKKAMPVISPIPTPAITFGAALSAATLPAGGVAKSGATVLTTAGTWAFVTPTAKPSAGTATVAMTFTPNDLSNYSVASFDATVTIAKAAATAVIGNTSRTYTGSPLAVTATASAGPVNVPVIVTYSGKSPTAYASSTAAPTAAGSYNVVVTSTASNYAITTGATATLTIAKAPVVLSIAGGTSKVSNVNTVVRTFGGDTSVSAITSPLGVSYSVTYAGRLTTIYPSSATAPVAKGTYTVTITVSDSNYSGTLSSPMIIQ